MTTLTKMAFDRLSEAEAVFVLAMAMVVRDSGSKRTSEVVDDDKSGS